MCPGSLEPGVSSPGWALCLVSQCSFLKACCVPSTQGPGDLYVTRGGGCIFIQLQPAPGPAHLRSPRASPAAGQTLALPT